MDWKTKRIIKLEELLRKVKDEVPPELSDEIEEKLVLKR